MTLDKYQSTSTNDENNELPLHSDQTINSPLTADEVNSNYLIPHNSPLHSNNILNESLRTVSHNYEIRKTMAERLRLLRDFEIVIVCDDSGSMLEKIHGTERTRWDELCYIVKIIIEIGVIFDSNGVDIYFLNREPYLKVKDPKLVDEAFAIAPRGCTPLVPVLSHIFQSPLANRGRDKKLLVFIATDGVPTDENRNDNVLELDRTMQEKRQTDTTHVSFLICTDDSTSVDYLDGWDRTMTHVDVTRDFHTERDLIRRYRGPNYSFSVGDYVVKALIGAVDAEIDCINEPS